MIFFSKILNQTIIVYRRLYGKDNLNVEETFEIADYVYFIANGRIGAEGTPAELSRSTDPFVRQFLDASPDGPVPFHYPGQSLAEDFGVMLK